MDSKDSLTSQKELDLVQHIIAEPGFWNPFLQINGIPNSAKCFDAIPLPPLLSAEGDVDVLVVDPSLPEKASAFQVKRIKVEDSAFDTELPNGIGNIGKLHQQSELLIDLGFWRVFSVVIVVVDGRMRNTDESEYVSLTPGLERKIQDSITTSGLNSELGLIRMDYVQSFPGPLLNSGVGGVALLRNANVRKQSPKVTDWVQNTIQNVS